MDLGRLTLWASRDVLDAVRHAAIDYGVSEGALIEAAVRALLARTHRATKAVLRRYGAARRRRVS